MEYARKGGQQPSCPLHDEFSINVNYLQSIGVVIIIRCGPCCRVLTAHEFALVNGTSLGKLDGKASLAAG
jgi:hypothetical protein